MADDKLKKAVLPLKVSVNKVVFFFNPDLTG